MDTMGAAIMVVALMVALATVVALGWLDFLDGDDDEHSN